MKVIRFQAGEKIKEGVLEEKGIIREIEGTIYGDYTVTDKKHELNQVRLLAPVVPSKVVCVGLNYRDHAREMKMDLPNEPVIFLKPKETVLEPEGLIIYPPSANQVDYEAELAIVIKSKAKNVSLEEAKKHILGYTCGNDVTARDLQKKDGQWTRAKSFDTFCPLGPWIVTDLDTDNLEIKLLLNGELKQHSSTKEMIFSPPQLVSHISQITTLNQGDVILTGTPFGVGPMAEGDIVEVMIEKIGILRNQLIKSKEASNE